MKTTSMRTGLLASTMLLPAILVAPAMFATSASAQESASETTTVVVTGSRLKTKDYKAISPVSTVTSETIALTATTSTEKLLNEMPQITPGNTFTSNNSGGEDFSTVDLRGLSPTRTLVLVNGERVPGSSTTGAVDINTIPADLIESVELVTGGASAVYGSDAISGVVNFKLKKNYQGAETNVSYGSAFDGNVPEFNWNALVGGNFDNGKGNVTAYASYYERKGVLQSAYDYSKTSATILYGYDSDTSSYTGSCVAQTSSEYIACKSSLLGKTGTDFAGTWLSGGSGTPPWGVIVNSGSNPFNAATLRTNAATSANFASLDKDCNPATANSSYTGGNLSFNDAGQLVPSLTSGACSVSDRASGTSRYNYAPTNNLVIPANRMTLFTTYNYELSPHARLSGQLSYVQSTTRVQLAATPATGLTVKLTPAMQSLIQGSHPDLWVALQSRANPLADFTMNYRTLAIGPRVGTNSNSSVFALNTLEGEFNDNWEYSVTTSFGKNVFSNTLENNAGLTQFKQGLAGCQNTDGSAITGKLPGCVPLDIFGAGKLSDAAVNFLGVDTHGSTTVTETRLSAFVRGDLFNLPAGPVSSVFGYEYRKSTADLLVDDAQKNGDIYGFNAVQDQHGKISVKEYYTELSFPIVRDLPFAKSANFEVGYRLSDYSTVGSVETYKVGADWSPVDWLRFRAAHNKAVRAPNVFELFQNGDQGFPSYKDPCVTGNATMRAFCNTQGVTTAMYTAGFTQVNSQVEAFAFGNPDLKPETAKSDTIGVVFQPDWFPIGKLRATVDYYKVHIDDAVADRGAATILASCYGNFGGTTQSAADCARIVRNPDTGQVTSIDTSRGNLTFFEVKGTDVAVEWSDQMFGGSLRLKYDASFLDSYNSGGDELKGTTSGQIGGAVPEYKETFNVTYKRGAFTYFTRLVYTPEMSQDIYIFKGAPKTPAASYVDASIKWDVNTNLSVIGNVSNLFDELPPVTLTGIGYSQANTDPQVYRVLGRSFNVAAKYKF